ncbi:MAG TPA: tryptophan synthase subunit alpha [Nitrospiria bacterium]|jgi:tryptophan synthase alpha chain
MKEDQREGRIEILFKHLRLNQEKAFVPYIMAGDPSLAQTEELVKGLADLGADLIELGVPFSDPIADGPVIQRASVRSLRQKTTLPGILDMVERLRQKVSVPIVLMTYYNPIMKYGEERFVKNALEKGVDGVIIPDLPPEEAGCLMKAGNEEGLDIIFLIAPTTSPSRMRKVAQHSRGFIYYVSLVGITGAKMGAVKDIRRQIESLRKISPLPILIGFGISTPQEASQAASLGDGVVVGSALVRQVEEHLEDGTATQRVLEGAKSLLKSFKK